MASEEIKKFDQALYVMYTNDAVNEYNTTKLNLLCNKDNENSVRSCRIDAEHNSKKAANQSAKLMWNLESYIIISKGCKVMITSNVCTIQGLTNGTLATVRHIIYDINKSPPSLPSSIILEMDNNYTGADLNSSYGTRRFNRFVSIQPIVAYVQAGDYLERTQYPLRLAYASTIHKCQGIIK